jgi:hypothetical protein
MGEQVRQQAVEHKLQPEVESFGSNTLAEAFLKLECQVMYRTAMERFQELGKPRRWEGMEKSFYRSRAVDRAPSLLEVALQEICC